nr:MAG TPA: hypothetical protein [Caudoviricetes sp.]
MEERYYQLDNLILSLDTLESETTEKDILEDIQALKFQYIDERDELEKRVSGMEAKEQRNLEKEYWASQF